MQNKKIRLFMSKVKLVKITDIISIFKYLLALPISFIYKRLRKDLWLICERKNDAQDNGYTFFKYVRLNHPDQDIVYAINKRSKDYDKVKRLGKVVQFGSLRHWILYLTAKWNLSSQKDGKPNAAIGYFLDVFNIHKSKMIYLKHGITTSNQKWIYYNETKFRLLICGAKPEYEYIKKYFGYPLDNVKYLGLSRFDELHNIKNINSNKILVMPTWRKWLDKNLGKTSTIQENKTFNQTEYYIHWNNFLNNSDLHKLLEKYSLKLIFYPHNNMQIYLNQFIISSKNIIIAGNNDFDVQTLLKESSLLITDYSSVFMDFAYMYKPTIYYHFDYEKYRTGHYEEGYFNYTNDGFGPIVDNLNELIKKIEYYINNHYKIENEYRERIKSFFVIHDANNSKRIYNCIKNLK